VSGDTAALAEAATPTPSGGEKPIAPVITSSNVKCYDAGSGNQDYEVRINLSITHKLGRSGVDYGEKRKSGAN
jgi:hypothetical protein